MKKGDWIVDILKKILEKREITAAVFLLFIFILVGLRNPDFLNTQSVSTIMKGSVLYIFLALGMTFVLLTGGIDVSVGAIMGLTAAVTATLVRDGTSMMVIVPLAIVIGVSIGTLNGMGVTWLKIPPIIMTLGTLGIIRGSMIIYTDGKWVENLPDAFKRAAQIEFVGMNLYFLFTIVTVIAIQLYLTNAKKGKYFAAIGDNADGATLVGIPVSKVKISAYTLSGLCAAIAGIVFTSQVGFVTSNTGLDIEMTAIAACVLGGVSLSGGTGTVSGACIGAIIMTTINSALIFLKVPSFWNKSIQGTLLIVIVVLDVLIQKYLSEKAKKQRLSARIHTTEKEEDQTVIEAEFVAGGGQS